MPSTQLPAPLGGSEHLSTWQGCLLGSAWAGSRCSELPQKLLMVPLLPAAALKAVPEETGTPASTRWVVMEWPSGGGWDARFTIGFGTSHCPGSHSSAWLLREVVGASLPGGSNTFPRRLQNYSTGERNLPLRQVPAPQPGPAQGPGRRDECLCVSVAVCVLSSPCSVGGLLSLCIVTPLTVVETATPINSSQELRLALHFCLFIGNKLIEIPQSKTVSCPQQQPAREQGPSGVGTVSFSPTTSTEVSSPPPSPSRLVAVGPAEPPCWLLEAG